MTDWILAVILGAALAAGLYLLRERTPLARAAPLIMLRAFAFILLFALLLDAPAARARPSAALVALDVSASWLRGGDSAAWRAARARARTLGGDSVLLFGDSVRRGSPPDVPLENATLLQPAAERALGAGRPLIVLTDGELDDPAAARGLPTGSRIDVSARAPRLDVAVVAVDAPRAMVAGDTLEARVTVRNGAVAAPAGTFTLSVAGRVLGTFASEALAPGAERTQSARVPFTVPAGPTVLSLALTTEGDVDRRNDTLSVEVETSRAAGAVLVSTSPDYDARFIIPILRGAVALPTRAYFRVAPGVWRAEGTLGPVTEADVRRSVAEAPLVILHGDTALFGPPRAATVGSLALLAPPADTSDESYPVAAPTSPISAPLTGVVWDSLPPLTAAAHVPPGDWQGLIVARARQFERRAVIVGSESGRRVVVVGASGFWRWRFRGGSSADAYAALWGGIFDWLSAERGDVRAAVPAEAMVRAGERIRWRRGSRGDSIVTVVLRRRGGPARDDSISLRFPHGVNVVDTDPLAPGIYDVQVPGGAAAVVVNASRELLPRTPTAKSGAVAGTMAIGDAPKLRDRGWIYLLVLLAVCAEWVLRRRLGLR